jgi:putative ABC transport system substrate-binding protein
MRRRDFIAGLRGAMAWPLMAIAQQRSLLPVVAYVSVATDPGRDVAFREGPGEAGYIEGRNVTVEYHILDGRFDHLPEVMAYLVRQRVTVIAAPGDAPAVAARVATATIPITFATGQDPVKLGLVASLARPAVTPPDSIISARRRKGKRLSLLHELVPKSVRVGVLVNPSNVQTTEPTLREVREAASAIGLANPDRQCQHGRRNQCSFWSPCPRARRCSLRRRRRILLQPPVQLTTLTARDRIPSVSPTHARLRVRDSGSPD